jgi:hypothetical protein
LALSKIYAFQKHLFLIVAIAVQAAQCFGQKGLSGQQNGVGQSLIATLDSLNAKANNYFSVHPDEKIYIHFDRTLYLKGEDCWYKAYVTDAGLGPTTISSVLYVDWINPSGKVINHKRLKIQEGGAFGDFSIDSTLEAGTYVVRAYTNWMRNYDHELFFSRQIQVIDPELAYNGTIRTTESSPIDLQFFPEGGTLIAGIKTTIAYKAIDAIGLGLEVNGRIIDEQDNPVTTFKSSRRGMGAFPFISDSSKSFRAVLESGEVFQLPRPSAGGFTLAASNMDPEKIRVRIQAHNVDEPVVYLLGQSRGAICYAESITINKVKDISIDRNQLPEGILHLTLFDINGVPQCERMLFIKKPPTIVADINAGKQQYLPRDSIKITVKVTDQFQEPVQTSLSVAITDADFGNTDHDSENIYTRLLLQSELKGNIENPTWYFESTAPERTYSLDLVMLTHGWSRYNWNKVQKPESELSFLPESGITLRGYILSNDKPINNSPFIFMISDSLQSTVGIYETDSVGYFDIRDLDFLDSTMVEWRVMKKKGIYANRKIELDENANLPPIATFSTRGQISNINSSGWYRKAFETFNKKGVRNFGSGRLLDEVVVKAKRINVVSVGRNQEIVIPTPADLLGVTGQFANRYAPGISSAKLVRISEDQEIWTTPSGGQIIVSIDGYVRSPYDFPLHPVLLLNSVAVHEVEYIAVSGDPYHGYFIGLKTKHPSQIDPPGSIKLRVKGYDVGREFYQPKYGPEDVSSIGPDNRITLYWNSRLSTDKHGIATIKFYNNDITEKFRVVVEGIANAHPISLMRTFGGSIKE